MLWKRTILIFNNLMFIKVRGGGLFLVLNKMIFLYEKLKSPDSEYETDFDKSDFVWPHMKARGGTLPYHYL